MISPVQTAAAVQAAATGTGAQAAPKPTPEAPVRLDSATFSSEGLAKLAAEGT